MVKQIKKRSSQNNLYNFIKLFTTLLKKRQLLDKSLCEDLIDKYNIKYWILNRLWSYFYNRPKVIWYLNQTVNNVYNFKSIDLAEHFIFLQQLFILNNLQNRDIYYLRKTEQYDDQRERITKLIIKYYDATKTWYRSKRDINEIWRLIINGIIDNKTLNKINKLINGEDSPDIILENIIPKNKKSTNISTKDIEPIQNFINEIKNLKIKSKICENCELFNRQIVVLDTNVSKPQEVDFMFIGINPGKEEREKDCPMVGPSGKLLREQIIYQLPINTKWVITNVILCSTNNTSEIKDIHKCLENCKHFLAKIYEKFPPKYIITIGDIPTKYFGITKKISSISGQLIDNKLIPCVHPSSIRRGNQLMMKCFQKARKTILELAKELEITCPQYQKQDNDEKNQTETWLNDIDKSWLYFDCCRLQNGDILLIFLDQTGKKQYKRLRNIRQPVYVKIDNFKNCSIITDKIDAVVHVTDYQKNKLIQLLRNQKYL